MGGIILQQAMRTEIESFIAHAVKDGIISGFSKWYNDY